MISLLTEVLPEILQTLTDKEYAKGLNYRLTTKQEEEEKRTAARDAVYGDDYYIEQGDTAMIRFDSFSVDLEGWKAFYAGTGERPLRFTEDGKDAYDTVGVVLSGLERAGKNPAIRNIVLDLSCNGGGDDMALYSIEWLLTGKGYNHFENEFNGQVKTKSAVFDMNFDGKFDENDVSPYTDHRYAVLTSNASFSCGNAFPWFMHEHNAMILGQRSGGGACGVRSASIRGIEYGNSASSSLIISDSGENVDFGCPLDVDLLSDGENPYADFYDLAKISDLMMDFFAVAHDGAA